MSLKIHTIFRNEKDLKLTRELENIIDSYEGRINQETDCLEISFFKSGEDFVKRLLKVTKQYPEDDFLIEHFYSNGINIRKEIYKSKNGTYRYNKTEPLYSQDKKVVIYYQHPLSLNIPDEAKPLLDEALKCFKMLNEQDKKGNLNYSPHKHTVEVEGENYKIVVSKHGPVYKVNKILEKVDTYEWKVAVYKWEEHGQPF